jgi:hypothetical protein
MQFFIKIKKHKCFILFKRNWINVNSEIMAGGGGIKGFCILFTGLVKCLFGVHRFHKIFRVNSMDFSNQCRYCRSEFKMRYAIMIPFEGSYMYVTKLPIDAHSKNIEVHTYNTLYKAKEAALIWGTLAKVVEYPDTTKEII